MYLSGIGHVSTSAETKSWKEHKSYMQYKSTIYVGRSQV
jgi:hypothetical protein